MKLLEKRIRYTWVERLT